MKCPNCQTENNEGAKFCRSCGTKLEVAAAATPKFCAKCGSPLKEGAKFCAKCGTPVAAAGTAAAGAAAAGAAAQKAEAPKAAAPQTAAPKAAAPKAAAPQAAAPKAAAKVDKKAAKAAEKAQKAAQKAAAKQASEKKKGHGGLIALIILLLLIIALVAVGFLSKIGMITLPEVITDAVPFLSASETSNDEEEESEASEEESEETDETETETETETATMSVEEAFAEVSPVVANAKTTIASGDYYNGVQELSGAIDQYLEIAAAEHLGEAAQEEIRSAYDSYKMGILSHVTMLEGQAINSGIYSQIQSEINDGIAKGQAITDAGYTVDSSDLSAKLEAVPDSFRTSYINQFNVFVNGETWSRTESWQLMEEAYNTDNGVLLTGDANDPLLLRYQFALAYYTRKTIETGLADGSMTASDAVTKIVELLPEVSYSPLLIYDLINYAKDAGVDSMAYQEAYDTIIDRIESTQGIEIVAPGEASGDQISLDKFWYFNTFDEHSVSDTNGVTTENLDWIRSNVTVE